MAASTESNTPDERQAALQLLLNGPAGKPPDGVVPNFNDPPTNLINTFYITVGLTLSFAVFAVIIRIYTRRVLLRSVGIDDYTSVLALLCFIGFAVPALLCQKRGAGIHMWDLQLKTFFKVLYWVNLTAITYAISITFVKLSILLQYLRIFVHSRKAQLPMFVAIHVCIWTLLTFYVVDTFFLIFLCTPRAKISNPLMTTGHCFNAAASYKASGVFNVLSDFAILILPLPSVWRLQMQWRRKLLTMGVFATGLFACVASILRSYYTWQTVESSDVNWELIPMGLWTWTEVSVGIIVGCLPAMPRFFTHMKLKISRSIPRNGPKHESSTATNAPKVGAHVREPGRFAKSGAVSSISSSWNGTNNSYPQLHDGYLILDEFDTWSPQIAASNEVTGLPGQGIATARDDLEHRQPKK